MRSVTEQLQVDGKPVGERFRTVALTHAQMDGQPEIIIYLQYWRRHSKTHMILTLTDTRLCYFCFVFSSRWQSCQLTDSHHRSRRRSRCSRSTVYSLCRRRLQVEVRNTSYYALSRIGTFWNSAICLSVCPMAQLPRL